MPVMSKRIEAKAWKSLSWATRHELIAAKRELTREVFSTPATSTHLAKRWSVPLFLSCGGSCLSSHRLSRWCGFLESSYWCYLVLWLSISVMLSCSSLFWSPAIVSLFVCWCLLCLCSLFLCCFFCICLDAVWLSFDGRWCGARVRARVFVCVCVCVCENVFFLLIYIWLETDLNLNVARNSNNLSLLK